MHIQGFGQYSSTVIDSIGNALMLIIVYFIDSYSVLFGDLVFEKAFYNMKVFTLNPVID